MAFEWTEINYMQIDAARNVWNNLIFPLAVVFVFLVLAAQYESWSLPLAVILVVPMCILGSLTGVAATHGDINIFTQIGFVVLVGLASKNAILIVEFAKHKHEEGGLPRRAATLEACKLRLRPILMTSFAFILGVVPLLVSNGAGAEMRRTLGVAVFSGMLGVTVFGIFLTPVFFYVIQGWSETPLLRRVGAASMKVFLALCYPSRLLARALRRRCGARPVPKQQPPVRLRTPAAGTPVLPSPAKVTVGVADHRHDTLEERAPPGNGQEMSNGHGHGNGALAPDGQDSSNGNGHGHKPGEAEQALRK
jgi:hypothetical protein